MASMTWSATSTSPPVTVAASLPSLALLDLLEDGVAEDADAFALHVLVQHAPEVHVEALQDFHAAVDQRRLDAEAVEDVGEFDRDIAAAGNDDRLRQRGQVEGLVGEDAMLVAGKRGMRVGPAAGRDQYVLGGDGAVLVLDAHRMRVDQRRAAVERLAARLLDAALVEAGEPGDLLVLVGDQRRPVEAGLRHGPAVAGGVGEMLGELRGVDEELLRHAAADDAGAAEAVFFRDRHALAERSRDARGAHAARPAADDEEIIVVAGHGSVSAGSCG